MNYKTIVLCAVTLLTIAQPAAARDNLEKMQACLQTRMHLAQAQESFSYIVSQEIKDEDVLVDLGYATYYMSPQDSVAVYNKQIGHLKNMSQLLGCNGLTMASLSPKY